MSWLELLTFAGTAGLLSAILNQLFSGIAGFLTRHRRAKHLALRLAVLMEDYSRRSIDDAGATALHESSRGHAGEARFGYRPLPELPVSSEAWELLRSDLAHRVLSFDFEVAEQNSMIAFDADIGEDPSAASIMLKTREIAATALVIAKDLRRAYDLPQFEPARALFDANNEQTAGLRAELAKREEQERKWQREMFGEGGLRPDSSAD